MMKVKLVPNPEFDFICGYVGGLDDVPTKQDKFKPIPHKVIYYKDDEGNETQIEGEFYISNNKAKENQKKIEETFIDCIKEAVGEEHPYKNGEQLEVVMNIKMSEKRLKSVDVDNLAKSALDYMKGLIFEDDNQVRSLFVYKDVIEDELIPQLSGVMVGVRILDNRDSLLAGMPLYHFVEISDEEYEESQKRQN